MKTPRYFSRAIAAGAFVQIGARGNYLIVASISASTIVVSLDGENEEQVIAGQKIYCRQAFSLLRIRNSGGAPATIVFFVTEDAMDLVDAANAAVLAAIAASVAGVDADTNRLLGIAAGTLLADTTVAATGGVGTLLFAATATRRLVQIQALTTNGGTIYLGFTNAVSSVSKIAELPAGASWYEEYYTGAVYAVGNDAAEVVCGYQE
jgi:hypothetical protein